MRINLSDKWIHLSIKAQIVGTFNILYLNHRKIMFSNVAKDGAAI